MSSTDSTGIKWLRLFTVTYGPIAISAASLFISWAVYAHNRDVENQLRIEKLSNIRFAGVLAANGKLNIIQTAGDYTFPISEFRFTPIFYNDTLNYVKGTPYHPAIDIVETGNFSRKFDVKNFEKSICANQNISACSIDSLLAVIGEFEVQGKVHEFQVSGL